MFKPVRMSDFSADHTIGNRYEVEPSEDCLPVIQFSTPQNLKSVAEEKVSSDVVTVSTKYSQGASDSVDNTNSFSTEIDSNGFQSMTASNDEVIRWKPCRFEKESQINEFYNTKCEAIKAQMEPFQNKQQKLDPEYRRLQR